MVKRFHLYEDGYEGKPEEEMLGTGRRIADGIRR